MSWQMIASKTYRPVTRWKDLHCFADDVAKTVLKLQETAETGNGIADTALRRLLTSPGEFSWNSVSIVLLNSGAIGGSVDRGEIRASDVLRVLRFGDVFGIIDIKGRFLRGALEHSVSQLDPCNTEDLFGGFLQVSGLRVKYNLREPVGRRVVSVDALCTQCLVPEFEPLVDDDVYRVIISAFLSNGGDGYSVIADNVIQTAEGSVLDEETFDDVVSLGPIFNLNDGRIQFVDCSDECETAPSTQYVYRRYGSTPFRHPMSRASSTCQRSKSRRKRH